MILLVQIVYFGTKFYWQSDKECRSAQFVQHLSKSQKPLKFVVDRINLQLIGENRAPQQLGLTSCLATLKLQVTDRVITIYNSLN
jgi:hypothetical protein